MAKQSPEAREEKKNSNSKNLQNQSKDDIMSAGTGKANKKAGKFKNGKPFRKGTNDPS